MEIEPDAIIRLASHDTFGLSDRRRLSNETVLGFLRRGLMTQGKFPALRTPKMKPD